MPFEAKAEQKDLSNIGLLSYAGRALIHWGKTGFAIVDNELLEKRENACLACPHLEKPQKFLQKLVTSNAKTDIGKRAADCVCGLCGCSISKKIRIPSELCPGQHPDRQESSRWGDVLG